MTLRFPSVPLCAALALGMAVFVPPARANLMLFSSDTGKLFLSVDGAGSNNASHVAEVQKPNASATVRKAFVMAASNFDRIINNGDVTIDGTPIVWLDSVFNSIPSFSSTFFNSVRGDVTAVVKPIVDAAAPGRTSFTFAETNTGSIDGEVLVVVFDDPTQSADSTVALLFGAQALAGDTSTLTLAVPIDPMAAGARADMGLGISFSFQGTLQYSIVDVNTQRLSTAAGGQDDGSTNNGALITVGGLDDSNTNPTNPMATPDGTSRDDDELYSLLPFLTASDTTISVFTQNPSNDDNVFFAYFNLSTAAVVGEGIVLSPLSASNPVGTQHTVTAKVVDDNGAPVVGRLVTFTVVSGPNAGAMGTDITDANGEATFSYSDTGGGGTDTIEASFVDSQSHIRVSNQVTKNWTAGGGCGVDLTPCDDGDGCTVNDVCHGGVCAGSPRMCVAADSCHLAGTCDSSTGLCSNPVAPDGTSCDDGHRCTTGDACVSGMCHGNPVVCDDGDACTGDSCDSSTGACIFAPIVPCCGNHVVESGETCDPPDPTVDPSRGVAKCRPDCTFCGDGVVQGGESCDDANTNEGCQHTGHPHINPPVDGCRNNCTLPMGCNDPSRITRGAMHDVFFMHVPLYEFPRSLPAHSVGSVDGIVVVELTNDVGSIYRKSIPLDSFNRGGNVRYVYRNLAALSSGGIVYVMVKKIPRQEAYRLTVRASGDLSRASARMTSHLRVGTREWTLDGAWVQTRSGWKLLE